MINCAFDSEVGVRQDSSALPRGTVAGLLLVLCVAFIIRVQFINQGMPYFYNEDEAHHFNRVAEMVKEGDWNPKYFHKPSFHFYLRIPVVAASFLWSVRKGEIRSVREIKTRDPYGLAGYAFSASHPRIVKWNRALSVAFSLGCILLAALITWSVTTNSGATIAAALVATLSPAFSAESATIGVDMPMAFLCMLAVYLSLRFYTSGALTSILMAGVFAGLAVSTKYNALPIMALPILAVALRGRPPGRLILVALVMPGIGFLLGSPFILASFPLFLDQFAYEIWHYGIAGHEGHMADPGLAQVLHYGNWLRSDALGTVLFILALLGFVQLICSKGRQGVLLAAFPALYFLMMVAQKANFTRNMLVEIPFLAIFAGFCWAASQSYAHGRGARISLLILFSIGWLLQIVGVTRAQPLQESRVTLRDELVELQRQQGAEVAASGTLQLAPEIYKLPGVSLLAQGNGEQLDLSALFLSGYDYLVIPSYQAPSIVQAAKNSLVKVEQFKQIPGIGQPQRVLNNPAISIFHLTPNLTLTGSGYETAVRNLVTDVPTLVLNLSGNTLECLVDGQYSDLGGDGKRHCWVGSRLTAVKFDLTQVEKRSLASQKSRTVEFEVMSPWPNQEIQFLGLNWEHKVLLPPDKLGKWQIIRVDLPVSVISSGLVLKTTQIRSPYSHGIGDDKRRLGFAIRSK